MIVVADTTPVNYLILIGEIDVLAGYRLPRACYERLLCTLHRFMAVWWFQAPSTKNCKKTKRR